MKKKKIATKRSKGKLLQIQSVSQVFGERAASACVFVQKLLEVSSAVEKVFEKALPGRRVTTVRRKVIGAVRFMYAIKILNILCDSEGMLDKIKV